MTRRVKQLLLIALATMLCMPMAGCTYMSRLQRQRATRIDEEHIEVNGTEYILLPESEYLDADFSEGNHVWLVDDKIPLLLIKARGESLDLSDDELMLVEVVDGYQSDVETYGEHYFCRADRYDEIVAAMKKGFEPDTFSSTYYDMYEFEEIEHVYTEYEVEQMKEAFEGKKLTGLEKEEYINYIEVYSTMKDFPFSNIEWAVVELESGYYLEAIEESGYYAVPEGLYDTVHRMMCALKGEPPVETKTVEDI